MADGETAIPHAVIDGRPPLNTSALGNPILAAPFWPPIKLPWEAPRGN